MNRDALDEELLQYLPELRAFARSLTRDVVAGDDLVHETIVKAWTNLDKFEAGTNLRAWLFTILRNTFYSMMRRRKREVEDTTGSYAASLIQQPQQDVAMDVRDFMAAFETLPSDQREALTLVGASGFSYADAAEICGCAEGTVKSRVNRARARLRELLSVEVDQRRAAA